MPNSLGSSQSFLARLEAIVGIQGLITHSDEITPYVVDWRGRYHGRTKAVVRPASTEQVVSVVKLCAQQHVPIVPQGGNTGLCGGSVPRLEGDEIVVALGRVNRVRAIDTQNDTITVEAGCVLTSVQQAAKDAGRLFPLSLAAEGSCQIGGALSTNAGGTAVLRYGNMRDLTLGLEVVLPDGSVWDGLRGLRKDNTGYDLKQLFIGAEGTLGIITAAVLKLFPRPKSVATALVALLSPVDALQLLDRLRAEFGFRLTGFELISRLCLDLVLKNLAGMSDPLAQTYPWYALVELSDSLPDAHFDALLENSLAQSMEQGLVLDAAVARSDTQREALWRLRENISEAQRIEGVSIKHDVSVPVSAIPHFIEKASAALGHAFPGVRIVAFGHMGDGNIHFNASQPEAADNAAIIEKTALVNRIVHDIVHEHYGSISAEHGLGQLKRDEIRRYKSELELSLMCAIKRTLDPENLMNPGKVL
jgi:FAD/FMN-containing dehydrogenase